MTHLRDDKLKNVDWHVSFINSILWLGTTITINRSSVSLRTLYGDEKNEVIDYISIADKILPLRAEAINGIIAES